VSSDLVVEVLASDGRCVRLYACPVETRVQLSDMVELEKRKLRLEITSSRPPRKFVGVWFLVEEGGEVP
jgi:hypothetical protein